MVNYRGHRSVYSTCTCEGKGGKEGGKEGGIGEREKREGEERGRRGRVSH